MSEKITKTFNPLCRTLGELDDALHDLTDRYPTVGADTKVTIRSNGFGAIVAIELTVVETKAAPPRKDDDDEDDLDGL